MKNLSVFALLVLLFNGALSAKEVESNVGQQVAYHFLLQKGALAANEPNSIHTIYVARKSDKVSFYVFGNDKSFVIVSGDDAIEPILGYATNNTFSPDNIPVQISSFLDGYSEQISEISDAKMAATPTVREHWQNLIDNKSAGTASKTTAVSPLMSTRWNQGTHYNADCPYDYSGGGRAVTGCVATAMAQVMKFWNWPATGAGIHSYASSCCGVLSANFGSTTYNWTSMPDNVVSPNPAVAKLMSHCGISVDMNYSASSSGAFVISSSSPVTNCAEYALKTYFKYKPSLSGKARSAYSETAWISLLKTELDAGRPIIFAGFGTGGGHCFVADGYDASNFFHMNWGWGGTSDGYFSINALNPGGLGTGGGSGGYNSNQQAIIGVEPNSTAPTASLQLNDYVYSSSPTIFYTDAFTISTNIANTGPTGFTGSFCAAAFNASGAFVSFIDSITGYSLPSGYMTGTINFSTTGLLSMLPGTYSIGIFYRSTGGGWVAVANSGPYVNFPTMDVVNHNPIQMASAMAPSPTTFVQGSPASVNFNLQNDGPNYTGSYDLSLYNLDGTHNSTIQTMTGMSLPAGFAYVSPFLTFSTSSITAAPGTYLLAVTYSSGASWYLCGTDYFLNPVYITVAAPPPAPDMYEVNNSVATAYNLPLTFTGDVATKNTTGSNIHVTTDNDYYKIVLNPGYNYSITARVNDQVSSDDATTYTVDAVWSYSTDGGTVWSPVYSDVMTGTINLTGGTGGTVLFKVSPTFAGNIGTYLLKLSNITRTATSDISELQSGNVAVYPNPVSDEINIDLSKTLSHIAQVTISDAAGRTVYNRQFDNDRFVTIPVGNIAAGSYFININTEAGILTRKITVTR